MLSSLLRLAQDMSDEVMRASYAVCNEVRKMHEKKLGMETVKPVRRADAPVLPTCRRYHP